MEPNVLNKVISDQYNEIDTITADRDKWKAVALELVKESAELHKGLCNLIGDMAPLPTGSMEQFMEISKRWVSFIQPVHEALANLKEMEK